MSWRLPPEWSRLLPVAAAVLAVLGTFAVILLMTVRITDGQYRLVELRNHVAKEIGAIAKPRQIMAVPELPKTRSGKILRGTIKKIADGDPWAMPATIEDPTALDDISSALKSHT